MTRERLSAVLAMLLFVGPSGHANEDKVPSVDELLKGAMDTRRAIRSAEVSITCKVDVADSKTQPADKGEYRSRWVISGNRILNRTTITRGKGQPDYENVDCRNCQASQAHSYWNNNDAQDKPKGPLNVASLRIGGFNPMVFDPRILGTSCAPLGTYHAHQIDSFREYLLKDVIGSSLARDSDGLYRLTFLFAGDEERVVRMSGPPAYRIVSYEIKTTRGGINYRATSSVESVDVPAPVYWFPKRQEFRSEIDGKVHAHEVSTIVLKSVNQPIPNSAFDIASFDLPAGTRVVGLPNSGPKVWDGAALIDESLYSPPAPASESVSAEAARGSGWLTWIAYAALAIGIAAFVRFLILRWRSRKA